LDHPSDDHVSALFDGLLGLGKRIPRPNMLTRFGNGFKQGLRIVLLVGTDKHTLSSEFLKRNFIGSYTWTDSIFCQIKWRNHRKWFVSLFYKQAKDGQRCNDSLSGKERRFYVLFYADAATIILANAITILTKYM